jgi:hypothetical protein
VFEDQTVIEREEMDEEPGDAEETKKLINNFVWMHFPPWMTLLQAEGVAVSIFKIWEDAWELHKSSLKKTDDDEKTQ